MAWRWAGAQAVEVRWYRDRLTVEEHRPARLPAVRVTHPLRAGQAGPGAVNGPVEPHRSRPDGLLRRAEARRDLGHEVAGSGLHVPLGAPHAADRAAAFAHRRSTENWMKDLELHLVCLGMVCRAPTAFDIVL